MPFFRHGVTGVITSVREITKATSLSRDTVCKCLRAGSAETLKYSRPTVSAKLAAYLELLTRMLMVEAHRPKKERRTVRAPRSELSKIGYSGARLHGKGRTVPHLDSGVER